MFEGSSDFAVITFVGMLRALARWATSLGR